METATLAGGCFWCTEAIFKRLKGVVSVVPGYTGGNTPSPTYEQVNVGTTGHAEAIQIKFDPKIISFKKLLEVFFKLHDPTTLNRQGADTGSQYRSAIFYHDQNQKQLAEQTIKELADSKIYPSSVVTSLEPLDQFYEAEDCHKDYYQKNSSQSYCKVVIDPKIQKLYKEFKEEVKK